VYSWQKTLRKLTQVLNVKENKLSSLPNSIGDLSNLKEIDAGERYLTQSELGEMIGVQKSQISRIERNAKKVTIETILRVFNALKAKVNFNFELLDGEFRIA